MKKQVIFTSLLLLSCLSLLAQTPEAINYQAVARDTSGAPLANQDVNVRLSIVSGSTNGTLEYQEVHSVTTNDYGLFTIPIGSEAQTAGNASGFSAISWGTADHFLTVEVDESGGSNYQSLGTTQFLSVPYALHAKTAESVSADTLNLNVETNATISGNGTSSGTLSIAQQGATTGQVLKWNGASWVPANDSIGEGTGVISMGEITNTDTTGVTSGQVLKWNGTTWVPSDDSTGAGSSLWKTNGSDIYYDTGRVGIGTSIPSSPLTIASGDTIGLRVQSSVTGRQGIAVESIGAGGTPGYAYMKNGTLEGGHFLGLNNKWRLEINDNPRLVVTEKGNVGIGTAFPSISNKLDVISDTGVAVSGRVNGNNPQNIGVSGVAVGANNTNIGMIGQSFSSLTADTAYGVMGLSNVGIIV